MTRPAPPLRPDPGARRARRPMAAREHPVTPERFAKGDIVVDDVPGVGRLQTARVRDTATELMGRGAITVAQHHTWKRIERAAQIAGMEGRAKTTNYDRQPGGLGDDAAERIAEARRLVTAARAGALRLSRDHDHAIEVCCVEGGSVAALVGRIRKRRETARRVLCEALDAAADEIARQCA